MVQAELRPAGSLVQLYRQVRALTEALADPLSPEDQTAQSMPDVSPTKWHRAHTSWFFETFVLPGRLPGYRQYHDQYGFLFNSYYETVGPFFPRDRRGTITRPGAADISRYRGHVDAAMEEVVAGDGDPASYGVIELGCHHEQQHQELILMDIKHVLSTNPLRPAYLPRRRTAGPDAAGAQPAPGPAPAERWSEHPGGQVEVGHDGQGFGFDNEFPRHTVHLQPFALAAHPVTNGDWSAFIADGGYHRPDLWLSEGWSTVRSEGWEAPLYWEPDGKGWARFTLSGLQPVAAADPVSHVSYFEADAYARWAGARLPTEQEWEAVASRHPVDGAFLDLGVLDATAARTESPFGNVWQWTSSAYCPYPGYRPGPGALGEYNGKFMVNQYVLRGGSAATPAGHCRATYRNFFPARSRWAFSGLRLARDL
ncbi:MAG TPA: ergothioneine biosynthesis protein EgtB [Acidimicrobiales bacterium]|nr:ergothioneine biosynthesis protein EgtB [Acidimicrobiales bacterium]